MVLGQPAGLSNEVHLNIGPDWLNSSVSLSVNDNVVFGKVMLFLIV